MFGCLDVPLVKDLVVVEPVEGDVGAADFLVAVATKTVGTVVEDTDFAVALVHGKHILIGIRELVVEFADAHIIENPVILSKLKSIEEVVVIGATDGVGIGVVKGGADKRHVINIIPVQASPLGQLIGDFLGEFIALIVVHHFWGPFFLFPFDN